MAGKCCDCKFCFPHVEFGYMCGDVHYGIDISGSLDEMKSCYTMGVEAFVSACQEAEVIFEPGTKLSELNLDGRSQIYLVDYEKKRIKIKSTDAKQLFGDLEVYKKVLDDEYEVLAIFNQEYFKDGNLLIVE